jgi:ATP-binding cassette subfamily B protein
MRTPGWLKFNLEHVARIRRALGFVWASGRGWTIASLALILVQGTLPLLALYLMKLVVDTAARGLSSADKSGAFDRLAMLLGLAAAIAVASALCRSAEGLVKQALDQRVSDHIHEILQAKSLQVDLDYYENPQYYDTLHRAQRDAFYRPMRILSDLVQVAQHGISLLALAGLLFSLNWGISLFLFASVIPGTLVRLKYADKMYRWQRARTSTERRAWYFNWMLTQDWHAKEVRLFDLGRLFTGQFRDLRKQLHKESLRIATRRSIAELITQTGATLAIFGLYVYVAYMTVQGRITIGGLVMYHQAFQRGQEFLRQVLDGLASLYEDNLFLSNFFEFLDLQPKVLEPLRPRRVPQPIKSGITFDNVRFRYNGGSRKVLEGVNLRIERGEHIALVGVNGAGKTTIVKLLCRLYDPVSGAISIDGIDLRDFGISDLRREMSVIFQDFARYYLTARENIWFGNTEFALGDDRILAAARSSQADEVISSLPRGYDTVLGKWFENGEELSSGQWQKVALARAFLREAQIIVLDEPTAALDARAEYEVFSNFHRLAIGKTAILISHRMSTVRMADRIYVLDAGRIVESGAHDELLRRRGAYANLFETQARYYR